MKNGKLRDAARRGVALLLSALTVAPFALFAHVARAAEVSPHSSTTNLVVWDWCTDMQNLGKKVNYDPGNPDDNTVYSRIMFYFDYDGDRYYFNCYPRGGEGTGYFSSYDENYVTLDEYARIGHSSHNAWNTDLYSFDHFITMGGERTPYISWAEEKGGYQSWRIWAANEDDTCSDYALMQVNDYENLDLRLNPGGVANPYTNYGADNKRFRTDGWIIDKHFVITSAGNYKTTHDKFVFWHWDNDDGGWSEALMPIKERNPKWYYSYNDATDTTAVPAEFKIYLGRQFKTATLTEDFTVREDQITTLGKPFFYIPKDMTIYVASGGVLSVDGMLLNDGNIVVEDGGLLIVKDNAKVMPFSKTDGDCGHITSYGSVVVESNALLCGGAMNGVRILGGGVVNYGAIVAEDMTISSNYAIENCRDDKLGTEGWVIAGESLTAEARINYIMDAVNQVEDHYVEPSKDFAHNASFSSAYSFAEKAVYGIPGNVRKSGVQAFGTPATPTISVFARSSPIHTYQPVFVDAQIDTVSLLMQDGKAVYTAEGKTYDVTNNLVAAYVSRGGKSRELLFTDKWAGGLDGAYVQFTPANATGSRLAINGNAESGASTLIWQTDDNNDKWWRIDKSSGTVDGKQIYNIRSVAGDIFGLYLAAGSEDGVARGDQAKLAAIGGRNTQWIFDDPSGSGYVRNAANSNLVLDVRGASGQNGTEVMVDHPNGGDNQKWRFFDPLSEELYASAASVGAAVEIRSFARSGYGIGGSGENLSLTKDLSQSVNRWTFSYIGTDSVDDTLMPYYQIINMENGRALTVKDGTFAQNQPLAVEDVRTENADAQYWYVRPQRSNYAIISRADSNFAITGDTSGSGVFIAGADGGGAQTWDLAGVTGLTAITEDRAAQLTQEEDPLDGKVFSMEPSHAKGMRLSATGASDRSPLDIQNSLILENQYWEFKRAGSVYVSGQKINYYTIRSLWADKYLDSTGTGQNGAKPWLYSYVEGNLNQQWIVKDAGDGYYYISPRNDASRCLICEAAGTSGGTSVTLYDNNKASEQKWQLVEEFRPVESGTFSLRPLHATNMEIRLQSRDSNDRTNVILYSAGADEYGRWTFVKMGEDDDHGTPKPFYKILNKVSGKAIDLSGYNADAAQPGKQLMQYSFDGYNDQLWYMEETYGGEDGAQYYFIANRANPDVCITVQNGGRSDNSAVILDTQNDRPYQKFKLEEEFQPVSLGVYEFGSPAAAQMRMDASDQSGSNMGVEELYRSLLMRMAGTDQPAANGTNIRLYHRYSENNKDNLDQQWRIMWRGNDVVNGERKAYYSIENVGSGRALDIGGHSAANANDNITLYDYDGYSDQHWYLQLNTDDTVTFLNRANPKLALETGTTTDGANVRVYTYSARETNQRWQLHPVICGIDGFPSAIPGNVAAWEAGIPFVEKEDKPVAAIMMNCAMRPEKNHDRLVEESISATSSANLYAYTAKKSNQCSVVPVGIDYFDGGGRVVYRILEASTYDDASGVFDKLDSREALSIYDANGGIGKTDTKAEFLDYTGTYDQMWYLEPVEGKKGVYYPIARGTFSGEKITLHPQDDYVDGVSTLYSNKLKGDEFQQWFFDGPK